MKSEGRSPIIRLVQTAAEQKSLEGIGEMLRVVTEELEGWGTLIWMPAPGGDIAEGRGRLFVLAYWISDERVPVWHELSFQSMAGHVLQSGRAETLRVDDPRIFRPEPALLTESNTQYLCLAPMTMADGTKAVLEVYRVEDKPFSEAETTLLSEMAAVIPALYATLTDRVGFKLTADVSDIRRRADNDGTKTAYDKAFQEIVERINQDFQCLEVSLFLQDNDQEPNICRLKAYKTAWKEPWTERSEYARGFGATGYVFDTGQTVRIVDLMHYEDDSAWIHETYPELRWANSLHIEERALQYFGVDRAEQSPPLSFLCAPLKIGESVFGAIRCCGSRRNPFYFDEWQARFLESVGTRVGAWWQNVLRKTAKEEEAHALDRLLAGFQKMNKVVQRNLGKHSWDEASFFQQAMQLAHDVIPKTGNSDVRMIDGNELVTKATCGSAWETALKRGLRSFRLKPHDSTAAFMIAERTGVLVYDDVSKAPYFNPAFTGTRKLIVAPIEAGEKIFGSLCLRSASPTPFAKSARLIAGLLGQQLGLYHSLALQILGLQGAEKRNQQLIETQAKTIKDVHHQVKSPIIIAHRTAQSLLENRILPAVLRPEVERLRGISGNVVRVVRNMGLFSDLSTGEAIRLNKTVLDRDLLLTMLRDACSDHMSLLDAQRDIHVKLDEKSFQDLAGKDRTGKLVEADWQLLEQCLNNVMDNAVKYSFDDSEIRVYGGFQSRATEFFIGVANEGLEIKPEEVHKLKQRGYRSDSAISAIGDGSGIGLWIVDRIMAEHGGHLAITPTTNGITDIRLVFPTVKGIENLSDATQNFAVRR